MAKKQKYYVVWNGHKPGIYNSWAECQLQIKAFPNAKYKSFENIAEAEFAYKQNYQKFYKNSNPEKSNANQRLSTDKLSNKIIRDSIAVDAACSGNPGIMEYRGVETFSKRQIFHQGPYEDGTNNIGEFLALVHALSLLHKHNNDHTTIYTDSKTAISWVKNKKAKTNLALTNRNQILFDLIKRAENWLKTHTFKNPIIKWETENWGEIPADFGRK